MRSAGGLEGGVPKHWGRKSRKTRGNRQTNWRAGARPNRSERWWMSGATAERDGPDGLILQYEGAVIRPFGPPGRPRQMSAAAWNAAGYSGTGAIKQARPPSVIRAARSPRVDW